MDSYAAKRIESVALLLQDKDYRSRQGLPSPDPWGNLNPNCYSDRHYMEMADHGVCYPGIVISVLIDGASQLGPLEQAKQEKIFKSAVFGTCFG